jgi:hypothetical protein
MQSSSVPVEKGALGSYVLAMMAAAQAPAPVAPVATAPAVQPAVPARPKKRKSACADDDEASLGSHISGFACDSQDDMEKLRQIHQAQQSLIYSGVAKGSNGPH